MTGWWAGVILRNQVINFQLLRKFFEDQRYYLISQQTRDCKGIYLKGIRKMNGRYDCQEQNLRRSFCRLYTISMKLNGARALTLLVGFINSEENSSVLAYECLACLVVNVSYQHFYSIWDISAMDFKQRYSVFTAL